MTIRRPRGIVEARAEIPAVRSVIRLMISAYAVTGVDYVEKLSDKIAVIVSDQNTIMDLKGILDARSGK